MTTRIELRITSKDFAAVVLIVECADETLCFKELIEGTEQECLDYVKYYEDHGMKYQIIQYESQYK